MKRIILILSIPVILFCLQNAFLFGLPFIHAGSKNSDVGLYLGEAEYSGGDISSESNDIYFVRFYPPILATVNFNQDIQGTYVGDNRGHNEVLHNVNWIKWTWVPCFDRQYAVKRSLSHPDGSPYWHPGVLGRSLLVAFIPILLILLILSEKFRNLVIPLISSKFSHAPHHR